MIISVEDFRKNMNTYLSKINSTEIFLMQNGKVIARLCDPSQSRADEKYMHRMPLEN